MQSNRSGASESFITYFLTIPRIILHLIPHSIIDSLDTLLKASSVPVTFHYDTVFNVGDFYLSSLTFRHSLFQNEPIIPCAFLVHSRRLQEDHLTFFNAITKKVSQMVKKRVNVVTDREFKFENVFPCGKHLYCWNHIIKDLQWYLKGSCNCTPEDVNYFVNFLRTVMSCETEEEFDRQWGIAQRNDHFTQKKKVLSYFSNNLIPAVKEHAAVWVLRAAHVKNPSLGITNNVSESFNAVLHRLQQWKQVPLDVITVSLHMLSSFYHREIVRSMHQCGAWQLKDEYDYMEREPSMMPFLPKVCQPSEIVDNICSTTPVKAISTTPTCIATGSNTHIGLANELLQSNRVKAVGGGAWVVTESDGTTHRAVRLFPKETCTCAATRTCVHITACRLLVGLPLEMSGKCNTSELNRRLCRAVQKQPSGKKRPRKNDFEGKDYK